MENKDKRKLCNLLNEYRKECCIEPEKEAKKWLMNKCDYCNFSSSSGCMIDVITLKLENDLWEG